MRIGFDGRALASPAGGVRRYVQELFTAMAAPNGDDEVVAIGATHEARVPHDVTPFPHRQRFPTNLGWTILDLPLAVRSARLDLFHAPAYTAPLWGVHPLVVTIHDVSYATHAEWYPYRRDPLRRWFYKRSALAADRIITDSQFSAREIQDAYGVPADRIRVVPLGVSEAFFDAAPAGEAELPAGVTRPYVLHVGDLHPRRNLRTLARAVVRVRGQHPELHGLALVLAGADRGDGTAVWDDARAAGHSDAVRLLGAVDDRTLARLYRGAAVFAYPSLYEGFGLPVLEAMASGVPVVAARAGATPEVVGDAGALVDPGDEEGFAAAIDSLVLDRDRAARLAAAGRARARGFTWDRTARETLRVYRELVA